ncbi:MAG: SDR family oxidoreductase [Deltaproteobacteria bacterium]
MLLDLERRTAVITGASRGIGRAVALALADEGVRVALVARSEVNLERAAAEIRERGGEAHVIGADLSDWDAASNVVGRATEALGEAPTIVVLSHGHMHRYVKVHSVLREDLDMSLNTDLRAPFALLGPALEEMMAARHGRVVVVGSHLGRMGAPKTPINSTVKAALEGLVRNIALDFGRYGVTANIVAPGFVDNERLAELNDDPAARRKMKRAAATRALSKNEDVARLVTFLCSPVAAQITGAVLPIDGGLHLTNLL